MEIYLVQGEKGEHEEYITWIVCAYKSETLARTHAACANREAKRMDATFEMGGTSHWKFKIDAYAKVYDKDMALYSSYDIVTITLREDTP